MMTLESRDPRHEREEDRYDDGNEYELFMKTYEIPVGRVKKEDPWTLSHSMSTSGVHFAHRAPFMPNRSHAASQKRG
jgi:hypothetical protein